MNHPVETELAKKLHAVYRQLAGNMGLGDHLPETWNAVAEVAEQECFGVAAKKFAVVLRALRGAIDERTTHVEPDTRPSSTPNPPTPEVPSC